MSSSAHYEFEDRYDFVEVGQKENKNTTLHNDSDKKTTITKSIITKQELKFGEFVREVGLILCGCFESKEPFTRTYISLELKKQSLEGFSQSDIDNAILCLLKTGEMAGEMAGWELSIGPGANDSFAVLLVPSKSKE